MQQSKIIAILLIAVLSGAVEGRLGAQSGAGRPVWETLLQKPLPEDSEPKVSVFSIPVGPAPPGPRANGAGHTHAGPVFAYILQGEIENQVEPDPPEIYKPGGFFYEAPMHVHRFLRNRSATEPAKLIVFQAGNTGQPVPVIKLLLQEPLRTTINQELILQRLTLPGGALADAPVHSGPGIVYVLGGRIELSGTTDQSNIHNAGDLFVEPASRTGSAFRNASDTEPAQLLLYQVNEKDAKGATR
jgi:quercetin dioxygenase-like cupin family protein